MVAHAFEEGLVVRQLPGEVAAGLLRVEVEIVEPRIGVLLGHPGEAAGAVDVGHHLEDAVARRLDDAAELPAGSAIIVDDFQNAAPAAGGNMTDLVERWPAETVQLVLASRNDPPLRLHRLRTPGGLPVTVAQRGRIPLVAVRLEPAARGALLAAHRSAEPGHARVLDALGLDPYLDLGMRLGEGSGAGVAILPLRAALASTSLPADRQDELRERCRRQLPEGPFEVSATAWAATIRPASGAQTAIVTAIGSR